MKQLGLIIPAGGVARRFQEGGGGDKLFAIVDGSPLLIKTLRSFRSVSAIVSCVIAIQPSSHVKLKALLAEEDWPFPVRVVSGASTRRGSVSAAFQCLDTVDQVMIHDAARPFLSQDLIMRILEKGASVSAVIPGLPQTDTIKRVKNGVVIETLKRDDVYQIQTPQLFDYEILEKAFGDPDEWATDEASLVERLGEPVYLVSGDETNIKVTYTSDLKACL